MSQAWEPSAPQPLASGEVHVWRATLRPGRLGTTEDAKLLSPQELNRAGSFRKAEDTDRFIIARATLRRLLATYLDGPSHDVDIRGSGPEKPYINRSAERPDVRFNIAHAETLGLFAFSLGCEVGVDCETRSSLSSIDAVLTRATTSGERESLAGLPTAHRDEEGLRLWTKKEAILKGLGTGLRVEPDSLDIGIATPSPAPQIVDVGGRRWMLFDLPGLPDAYGSVAVQADAVRLHTRTWPRLD